MQRRRVPESTALPAHNPPATQYLLDKLLGHDLRAGTVDMRTQP